VQCKYSRQRKRAVSANTFLSIEKHVQNIFRHRLRTLVKLFVKLGTAGFVIWTWGKLSRIFSSATFDSENALGFG